MTHLSTVETSHSLQPALCSQVTTFATLETLLLSTGTLMDTMSSLTTSVTLSRGTGVSPTRPLHPTLSLETFASCIRFPTIILILAFPINPLLIALRSGLGILFKNPATVNQIRKHSNPLIPNSLLDLGT